MLFSKTLLPNNLGTKKGRLYKQSKADFYAGRNKIPVLASMQDIVSKESINTPLTEINVEPEKLVFGSSSKELFSAKGKPNFTLQNDAVLKDLKVYFYRVMVNGVKCIQQFHYYKNQFFYAHVEFRNCPANFDEQLQDMLMAKYKLSLNKFSGAKDTENNLVLVVGGLTPAISYVAGKKALMDDIKNEIERLEMKKATMNMNKMEKLFEMI